MVFQQVSYIIQQEKEGFHEDSTHDTEQYDTAVLEDTVRAAFAFYSLDVGRIVATALPVNTQELACISK